MNLQSRDTDLENFQLLFAYHPFQFCFAFLFLLPRVFVLSSRPGILSSSNPLSFIIWYSPYADSSPDHFTKGNHVHTPLELAQSQTSMSKYQIDPHVYLLAPQISHSKIDFYICQKLAFSRLDLNYIYSLLDYETRIHKTQQHKLQ